MLKASDNFIYYGTAILIGCITDIAYPSARSERPPNSNTKRR